MGMPARAKPRLRPRDRAVTQLRGWLSAGRWPAGARIAGELDLVAELGVSRRTVRAALAAVEAEGLLASRGRGGRVAVARSALPAGRLSDAMVLVSQVATTAYSGAYLAAVDSAALQLAQGAGHDVLVLAPSRIDVGSALRDRPLGIVLGPYPSMDRALVGELSILPAAGIPLVVLGDEPWQQRLDRVVFDHRTGGHALASWLIAHGRRRLACAWDDDGVQWQAERRHGVAQACQQAGLPPPIAFALPDDRGDASAERFAQRVEAMQPALATITQGSAAPDAILTLSDAFVFPCAAALRRLGRQPGADIEIVGYDGYAAESWERAFESYAPPASVDKDNRAAGAAMVRLLLDRVAGRLPAGAQRQLIAPRLLA